MRSDGDCDDDLGVRFIEDGIEKPWLKVPPLRVIARQLPRCVFGVMIIGIALPLLVRAKFGLGPWEVLSDGLRHQTGLALGTAAIIVGVVSLLLWIPLRQPIGIGTFLSVVVFGIVVNAVLPLVPEPSELPLRLAYLATSIVL